MATAEGLLALAESVADGSAIDWDVEESTLSGEDRAVVQQLRVIADLAALHRTLPADPSGLPNALTARRASVAPAVGRWAHLDLIERLGGGAFGDVYRAFDRHLEREVALKLLHADVRPEHDFRSSAIVGEGRRLARVRHPNVVTVFGVAMHDGRVGLWMELVKGLTLEQLVKANGPMSAGEAALVGVDLCRALAALHAADLIHRDIKTQNVMREDGGRIVLMDFGTSRAVNPDESQLPHADMAGTPLYLAPEIFEGAPASVRTDVYSLGVLLYRLVTNEVPVRASTMEELHEAHAAGRRVRLRDQRSDLPSEFVRVVERAIAPDPADRYATAGELEADLLKTREEAQPARRRGTRAGFRQAAPWLLGVIVAALLAWPVVRAVRERVPTRAAPGAIKSIAVLPLANLSGDASQDYFTDGITDELITTLGRAGGVDVISRTSSMLFKRSSRPLPEIARLLHADAIVEGTVTMLGTSGAADARRVRITARLIYAGSDTLIWDRTFERVVDDIFALQRDVAESVVRGISAKLTVAPQAAQPIDFETYKLYLEARSYWNQGSRDALTRSVTYFSRVIERAPTYAPAYAGLASAYNIMAAYGFAPRAETLQRAVDMAKKAQTLDPQLSDAYAALGFVHNERLEWSDAADAFAHALRLNPADSTAHHWYANFLAEHGRFDEAIAEIRRAIELDPLSARLNGALGAILVVARQYDAAIDQLAKTLRMDPGLSRAHMVLAEAYVHSGQYERALASINQAAAELNGGGAELRADIGYIHARSGRQADTAPVIADLLDRYRHHEEGAAGALAVVYAALGNRDRAMEWLDRARALDDPVMSDVNTDPRFDAVRADPRFTKLLAELGFAQ